MSGGRSEHEGARVILVGNTGMERSLRARPEIELVRTRTAIDAIGELASPIDESSPRRAAIVVGRDSRAPQSDEREFVHAARLIDPEVLIVGVSPDGAGSLDGAIADERELGTLLGRARPNNRSNGAAAMNGASSVETLISSILRPDRSGETEVRCVSGAGSASDVSGSQLSLDALHDAHMVRSLLRGEDVLPVAIGLLRGRLRTDDVSFLPVSKDGAHERGVPVAWGQAVLGRLVVGGLSSHAVEPHAAWLAGWLRLRDQQSDLRHAAFTDSTTGAWNRRYFDRFLSTALEDCRLRRRTLTLLVFDVDDFKKYNDQHGHGAGDEILSETVRLMKSVVRPSDRVCRIGGDEFAVIFYEPEGPREPNSRHPDSICKLAERFQQQIGRHRFPKLGSEAPGSLSISAGLATFPWDGATAEQLLHRADQRALESKRSGKNALTLGPGAIRRGE